MFPLPSVVAYQCPAESEMKAAFSVEMKKLIDNIPTLLLADLHNPFCNYYRHIIHGNVTATPPETAAQHLHFIICHDPNAYKRGIHFQYMTPALADSVISTLGIDKQHVIRNEAQGYTQIEKLIVGNNTVNITFLFHGINGWFSFRQSIALLAIASNKIFFANQQALDDALAPPKIENIVLAKPTEHTQPMVIQTTTHVLANSHTVNHAETVAAWTKHLHLKAKPKETTLNKDIISDSYYSALKNDAGSHFIHGSNELNHIFNKTLMFSRHKVHSDKDIQSIKQQRHTRMSSTVNDISNIVSWVKPKERTTAQNDRIQSLKRYLDTLKTSSSNSGTPAIISPEYTFIKNLLLPPQEKQDALRWMHIPSHIDMRVAIIKKHRALFEKEKEANFEEATRLKINDRQRVDIKSGLWTLCMGALILVGRILLSDKEESQRNTDIAAAGIMILGASIIFVMLESRRQDREEMDEKILNECFNKSFETLITHSCNSAEMLEDLTLSIHLMKDLKNNHALPESLALTSNHTMKFIDNTSELIEDRPFSFISYPFMAILPLPFYYRLNATSYMICTLNLVHGDKLLSLINKNAVPEISLLSMKAEDQIELINQKINSLQNLITPQMKTLGMKRLASNIEQQNKAQSTIFDLLDDIMLIYLLRNATNENTYFAQFKKDYAPLVTYAEQRITSVIECENEHASFFMDAHSIHQIPLKSKIATCAYIEQTDAVIHALTKMTMENRQKPDDENLLSSMSKKAISNKI